MIKGPRLYLIYSIIALSLFLYGFFNKGVKNIVAFIPLFVGIILLVIYLIKKEKDENKTYGPIKSIKKERTSILETIILLISVVLFFLGASIIFFSDFLCIRDNETYYKQIQPEFNGPDDIGTVLYEENTQQLYVCYYTASYVNVYSENGDFLWGVSTPYVGSEAFDIRLDSGYLVIDDSCQTYFYNAVDGAFIKEAETKEEISQSSLQENNCENAGYFHNRWQVYRTDELGNVNVIVSRPWWYWPICSYFPFYLVLASIVGFSVWYFVKPKK